MNFKVGLTALFTAIQIWAAYPNGPSSEGTVDANKLLEWVKEFKNSANLKISNGFANRDGEALNVSLYQVGNTTSGATFWESNMDVDCDGSNTGDCSGFDPSHQSTLSCGCSVAEGGTVDANSTPFFVIPIDKPFDYSTRGIQLGQIAACLYKTSGGTVGLAYAVFLDEDGDSTEIGEGSPALNRLLGINPNPDNGGSESGNTYIIFPGSTYRLTSNTDRANHALAVSKGVAAANALLASYPTKVSHAFENSTQPLQKGYAIKMRTISIQASGNHSVSIFNLAGENVMSMNGVGKKSYGVSNLKSGSYIVKLNLGTGTFTDKVTVY